MDPGQIKRFFRVDHDSGDILHWSIIRHHGYHRPRGALNIAIEKGNVESVRSLLEDTIRVTNLLPNATRGGNVSIIKLLLQDKGVDPHTNDGCPPRRCKHNENVDFGW